MEEKGKLGTKRKWVKFFFHVRYIALNDCSIADKRLKTIY